ncbi:LysM peptidoglycan-binding domain-containing protein [Marinimicrobium agarilyticum]|uniref:LysM peptidoglycan-binding domain-containing protein n=1 Tax=Marinimicrobium agarilyticum TaxID=306546 RepID=UPI00041A76C1|nr:LysM domain-containing protein [Marinimicrobium agarilyticum]
MNHSVTSPETDTVVHRIRPGDTLSAIVKRYYGPVSPQRQQELIQQIVASNRSAKNASTIYADQLLKLEVPQQYCAAPKGFPHHFSASDDWFITLNDHWTSASPAEREVTSLLTPLIMGGSSAKLAALDRTFKQNAPLLREMVENYESYKGGDLTKGQYDYRRRKLVSQLSQKLGPTQWLLNGTSDLSEVLRISRNAETKPVSPLKQQAKKLANASRLASAGGIVLTAVSLKMACDQIAEAESGKEKSGILVETVTAATVGLGATTGISIAVALAATPVGWVASLVIATGVAAVSYASGRAARHMYDSLGNPVDLSGATGVSALCSNKEKPKSGRLVAPGLSMRL